MPGRRICYVYILASRFRTLYVGVTNDLDRRVLEHRERRPGTYTARYRINRLVYFEIYSHPADAIAREKQIKGWRRDRKELLIEAANPEWRDLLQPGNGDPGRDSGDPSAPEGASG